MKVSEAMRLADEMGLPDLRHTFIEEDTSKWVGEKPPCCAIGGASVASRSFEFEADDEALGRLSARSFQSALNAPRCEDWDRFRETQLRLCPICSRSASDGLYSVVTHLYDTHLWSRTQIANWLDTSA